MLTQNYFVLLDMPQSFALDATVLAAHYRQLQKRIHPDKFAGHTEQEQRLAVQFAAYVNQAYDCLRSPLKRAVYLLEILGVNVQFDQLTISDPPFLAEQMALREGLMDIREQADPLAALDLLKRKVEHLSQHLQLQIAEHFALNQLSSVQQQVAKLHFVCKLLADIHQYEDQLIDEF